MPASAAKAAAAPTSRKQKNLTLINWNIQWGLGMDGRQDIARIVREAKRLADFDVLCLQEVAAHFTTLEGSMAENQFHELCRALPDYQVIAGCPVDLAADPVVGEHRRRHFGNVIATRLPVSRVLRHSLPWLAPQPGDVAPHSMPRLALEVVVQMPSGAPLRIVTTHLEYFSSAARKAQVDRLCDIHDEACARAAQPLRKYGGAFETTMDTASCVLCGDFNMPESDAAFRKLQAVPKKPESTRFTEAWEAVHESSGNVARDLRVSAVRKSSRKSVGNSNRPPSFRLDSQNPAKPPMCCDFVLVTDDLLPKLKSVRYDQATRASDHQPVIVELAI
jgi:endonuclease/exonuclease/phosphatase family metal-dependent hydrolase